MIFLGKMRPFVRAFCEIFLSCDAFSESFSPNVKTNDVIYVIVDSDDIITGVMDLMGPFPQRTSH